MIKIAVDAFGGDNAPVEVVKGCVKAVVEDNDLKILLCGKEEVLLAELAKYKYNAEQIEIVNATEVIDNNESPTLAIRQKKDSSIAVALDCAKNQADCVGVISAGSTGAVLTGAFLKLGRLKGVARPALCPILPTFKGTIVSICDCGANMDCKPEYLEQFALMGNAYLKVIGVDNPRVALLNVGTEDHKGDTRAKEAFEKLTAQKDKINFVGNMEARDLLSGDYDLIVTDGFAGNVLLKSTEGAVKNIFKVIKKEISSSISSKFGYLFMRKSFGRIKDKFDYSTQGGAVLLGTKKLVVKVHGSSDEKSFYGGICQMKTMAQGGLLEKIAITLEESGLKDE